MGRGRERKKMKNWKKFFNPNVDKKTTCIYNKLWQ